MKNERRGGWERDREPVGHRRESQLQTRSAQEESTTDKLALDLIPGGAILLRVQVASDEAFTCEYKLAE